MKNDIKPIAWCIGFDDARFGTIYSNPTMDKLEAEMIVKNAIGKVYVVPLFTIKMELDFLSVDGSIKAEDAILNVMCLHPGADYLALKTLALALLKGRQNEI